ncbi:MAG: hypothetical protein WCJ84_01480 [Candidatus Peregrinibacteria bacterium]
MMLLQKYLFSGHLDDGEKLFEAIHKHHFEILPKAVAAGALGIIAPWTAVFFFSAQFPWWAALLVMLLFGIWIFYHIVDWYFDVWLITNFSLIQIEWHGLFDKSASRIDYEDLKEVGYSISGVMASSMDFGTVTLTSVSGGETVLENVPHPKEVEMMIRDYKARFLHSQHFADSEKLERILDEMVKRHVEEHGIRTNPFATRARRRG